MRVHLAHHEDEAALAKGLEALLGARDFETAPAPEAADVVLVLVSEAALRDGLGDVPRRALATDARVVTVLVGEGVLPRRFPVPRKHTLAAGDPGQLLHLLVDLRKNLRGKIILSKRDLFQHGVLLGLLHR